MPVNVTTTEQTDEQRRISGFARVLQALGINGTALGLALMGVAIYMASTKVTQALVDMHEESPAYRASELTLERKQIEHKRFLATVGEPFVRLTGWSPEVALGDSNDLLLTFPALEPKNGSIQAVSVQVGKWNPESRAVLNRKWVPGVYREVADGQGEVSISVPALGFFEPNRNYSFRLRVRVVGPEQGSEVLTYMSKTYTWWRSPK